MDGLLNKRGGPLGHRWATVSLSSAVVGCLDSGGPPSCLSPAPGAVEVEERALPWNRKV